MNTALPQLFWSFCLLSVMAVGGANALIPEMHRQAVELNGWMSGSEFAALFAIAQAAPGPNILIVTLVGWKVAGLPGAAVTTLGMCGPSSLLAFWVSRLWDRFRTSPWRLAIQRGLAPITIGLVLGSGYLLTRAADHSWLAYGLTGITAAVALSERFNPLWLLATGGMLGLLGFF